MTQHASRTAPASRSTASGARRWMWLNGLALVMFSAFIIFLVLQSIFGCQVRIEAGHRPTPPDRRMTRAS